MTRFLGVLVVVFAVIALFGYFRGWFHAESHDINGQSTVSVTVDKDKFDQDKVSAQQDVQNLGNK
jgi:hypothetical protein